MTIAYVFPGQGSQTVGMGAKLAAASPAARRTFLEADEVLGFPLSRLCWEGPEEELTATANAQPALLVSSVAAWRAGVEDGLWRAVPPSFVAGHSLGEYSALVVAGALTFPDALRLVRRRGELMHACGLAAPSTMAAVLGLDEEAVATICAETGAEIANVNAPGQIGISGPLAAVERASALARERGARRVLPLNVSAAFHSSVMLPAAEGLAEAIAATPVADAQAPLIGNVDAVPITRAADIRRELVDQLTRPVRWQRTIEVLAEHGVTALYEVGTGTVLCGLAKRIAPQLSVENPVEAVLGKGSS
ncbi:MAG: malonyl CoA-acyl carrier protein transacylase [Dehalococcoidia bacterium]|jgi:[acyl-carrier-protein] S-malonyltransferase|nr:MAG: malonyl CoA-acyl carrier protein transacylase [Dehalococcoidia bacterium]